MIDIMILANPLCDMWRMLVESIFSLKVFLALRF